MVIYCKYVQDLQYLGSSQTPKSLLSLRSSCLFEPKTFKFKNKGWHEIILKLNILSNSVKD